MGKDIYGTAGDDTLEHLVSPGIDIWVNVWGGAGNDTIRVAQATAIGEAGNDTIIGMPQLAHPASPYAAAYWNSPAGVSINLATGTAQDGFGTTDTLVDIHTVKDSRHDDQVIGSAVQDTVWFSAGNDSFVGGGGLDRVVLDGLRSSDTVITYDIASNACTITDTGPSNFGTKTLSGVTAIDFWGPGSDNASIRVVIAAAGGLAYTGANGEDIVRSGANNDVINGMNGKDTVVYSGNRAGFTVTRGEAETSVSGALGNDTLTSIERIVFDDRALAFDTEGIPGQVYRLYEAAFNRTPDMIGIGFWINRLEVGVPLRAVSNGFVDSGEFKTLYSGADNREVVSKLYANILDRAGDQSGIEFWTGVLDRKEATMAEVLEGFRNSAEFIAKMVGVMSNGVEYIPYG